MPRERRIGVNEDALAALLASISKIVCEALDGDVEDVTVEDLIERYEAVRQAIEPQTGTYFAPRLPPVSAEVEEHRAQRRALGLPEEEEEEP